MVQLHPKVLGGNKRFRYRATNSTAIFIRKNCRFLQISQHHRDHGRIFVARFDESGSPELWNLPIDSVRAMTEEEFNAASYALDNWNFHSQNVVLLAKRKGTDQNIKDAEDFLKFHENAGGLSFEDLDSRREIEERINSGQKLPESDFNVDIPSLIAAIQSLMGWEFPV
ncbi:MAG: hypothetical protein HRU78_04270 [Gammaproteobacteria bacterium]|nr:MAG: hypothetical protein HRU78_04270 [Gammaproteobacteria bacterium]